MNEHTADTDRTEDRAARWVTPDYQIVETSMEVTAYLTAED
ncbi:pyrroloquinoline quinone precursor peptide PqqA [Actinomadura sediminis]|uniref:Coenzyme PQQ synthesis protein A n=1 Tax=Actinomadura sediminis TaxID=1038904 RepID=A0ABW3EUW0_9ACTN